MNRFDDFDRSFRNTRRMMWIVFALIFTISFAWLVFLGWAGCAVVQEIDERGGVGKALGEFIGDVQEGVSK